MATFTSTATNYTYSTTTAGCGNCSCRTGECRSLGQTTDRWLSFSTKESDLVVFENTRRPEPPRARRGAVKRVTSVARAANIPVRGAPGAPGCGEAAAALPAPAETPEAWGASLRAWDKR